jgi:hypothetical protein
MKVKTINSKYCFICSPRFATFLHLHKIPQVYISMFGTKKILIFILSSLLSKLKHISDVLKATIANLKNSTSITSLSHNLLQKFATDISIFSSRLE